MSIETLGLVFTDMQSPHSTKFYTFYRFCQGLHPRKPLGIRSHDKIPWWQEQQGLCIPHIATQNTNYAYSTNFCPPFLNE